MSKFFVSAEFDTRNVNNGEFSESLDVANTLIELAEIITIVTRAISSIFFFFIFQSPYF
jgi:hypothetical protein